MTRILVGIIALMAMLAGPGGPAGAADMRAPVLKAPPLPVYLWEGFYLGLNAGYGWGRTSSGDESFDPAPAFFFALPPPPLLTPGQLSSSFRQSGAIAGVQGGYNWQLSPAWVAGIETDIQYAHVRGSSVANISNIPGLTFTNATEATLQWFGTVR